MLGGWASKDKKNLESSNLCHNFFSMPGNNIVDILWFCHEYLVDLQFPWKEKLHGLLSSKTLYSVTNLWTFETVCISSKLQSWQFSVDPRNKF